MRWTCRRLRLALVDAALGTLAPDAASAVQTHTAVCARCRADLAAMRAVTLSATSAPTPPLAEDFWRSQRQTIMRRVRVAQAPAPPSWRPAWRVSGVFATVLLAVLVSRTVLVRPPMPQTAEHLDDEALLHLHDLLPAIAPASSVDDPEGDLPSVHDLGADELDRLAELIGDGS
jgi:anti-sigma factor RsiW